jgi:hypothetical protein
MGGWAVAQSPPDSYRDCHNDYVRTLMQKRVRVYACLLRENCSIRQLAETAVYDNRTYSGMKDAPVGLTAHRPSTRLSLVAIIEGITDKSPFGVQL